MRALLPGLVCCALLVAPAAAAGPRRCGDDVGGRAVPCDCGDVLIGSRTLGADDPIISRVCPGSGLLVAVPTGAPAARLALGGHVLAGSGSGVGIQVVGGGAGGLTIAGPGGVRGFATGIQAVNGTLARLADVVAADNASDGFVLAGEGFAVLGSEASHNGRDGFVLRGHRYRVERNRALANGRDGFVARGREAAIGGEAGNEATGNGREGFRVRGQGHDVARAVATANSGDGVRARLSDGRIAGSLTASNRGRGVRAAGHDLALGDNQARDNGGGLDVHGARVRDDGGNRAEGCRVGGACR